MARSNGIYLAFASICLLSLCSVAVSDSVSCEDATAATVNGTRLLGTWYEAARKPVGGGVNAENCVQLIISYDNGTVNTEVTYNIDSSSLSSNETINKTIVIDNTTSAEATSEVFLAVFNVTSGGVNTTYKILDTDYTSYAFICGYIPVESSATTTTVETSSTTTVSSSNTTESTSSTASSSTTAASTSQSTAGAFIITRERQINSTLLANLTASALVSYSDFANISTVIQSAECYEVSGAATTVPMLAMVMAIVYTFLKLVH